LAGWQGARLSHLMVVRAETPRISRAIGYLREHFDESIRMDEIAHELGMSVSGFHHHF
jgi:AraC-like DNA-binding protein